MSLRTKCIKEAYKECIFLLLMRLSRVSQAPVFYAISSVVLVFPSIYVLGSSYVVLVILYLCYFIYLFIVYYFYFLGGGLSDT